MRVDALIAHGSEASIMSDESSPALVVGRADMIDAAVQAKLGIALRGSLIEATFHVARGNDAPPYDRPYLPEHQPIAVRDGARVLYRTEATPLVTSRGGWAFWQPPDWSEPFNPFVPKYQLGSTYPHSPPSLACCTR
ncbi:MAG: hypothetical protein U0703_04660 [Anaerolineae bacterium]